MFKLFVFAAALAVASAGLVSYSGLPLAYSSQYAVPAISTYSAPYAYASHIAAAPLAYAAAPAVAAVPAPVTYTTGNKVLTHVEPVEQHGYKIVY